MDFLYEQNHRIPLAAFRLSKGSDLDLMVFSGIEGFITAPAVRGLYRASCVIGMILILVKAKSTLPK
jgi:hypothetical protein